jgi:hypothetical protein
LLIIWPFADSMAKIVDIPAKIAAISGNIADILAHIKTRSLPRYSYTNSPFIFQLHRD